MVKRAFLGKFQDLNVFDRMITEIGIPNQINQVSRGLLSGQLMALNLGPLQLLRVDFNQAMVIRGSKPPKRFLFAMTMAQRGGVLKTHGRDTPQDYLYGNSPSYNMHLLTPPQFKFAVVSVDQGYFRQFLKHIGRETLGDRLQHENWQQIDADRYNPLKAYVREIFQAMVRCPQFLDDQGQGVGGVSPHQLITENLLPLLAACLTSNEVRLKAFEAQDNRLLLVKQAESLIEENLDKPITLTDLYQSLHTSRRTLIYAFNDVVGMSPIAYIKVLRLNAIRRCLLIGNPQITSVFQIARQYGFWSHGHFSRDYRILFGESPSQTLRGTDRSRH